MFVYGKFTTCACIGGYPHVPFMSSLDESLPSHVKPIARQTDYLLTAEPKFGKESKNRPHPRIFRASEVLHNFYVFPLKIKIE
ncbi:hypothetical protein HI914_04008 [Erysiphe necator]|nr:hypothetical protein HI914_04008 [Erysiphe necator]